MRYECFKKWCGIVALLCCSGSACDVSKHLFADRPSSGNSPQEMFEAVLHSPMPKDVVELQGTGDTMQGYDIYLRFRASAEWVAALRQGALQEIPCKETFFAMPNRHYDIFTHPPWGDLKLSEGHCFVQFDVHNRWTQSGTHYFHINPITRVIHFHGTGA